MPEINLRPFRIGEENAVLRAVDEAFGRFHDPPEIMRVLSSRGFSPNGCFLAEEKGSVVGCVAVTSLPRQRWYVVRYLALKHAMSRIKLVERLVAKAIDYAESNGADFLRATTPSLQPYVEVYKNSGFKPLRRDLRIVWDLGESPMISKGIMNMQEVSCESPEASKVFMESLHPYWDWRTEEQGGSEAVALNFREGTKRGERWLLGLLDGKPIGLFGLIPNYFDTGQARFRGAYIIPDSRGMGFGSALMVKGINWARNLGQKKMVVYTFSYLDSLAPGALLYLKSGGKIESEYLQLQKI